jgi:hypothetical protein
MENNTTLQMILTTSAAFDILAKSLQTQSNLQFSLGNYDLANQLQDEADKVIVMSYQVRQKIK